MEDEKGDASTVDASSVSF